MKTPFISHEKLTKIAADFGTPFHLYDEHGIRENARKLHKAFEWNSGYREFFAVKANPNPTLLGMLKEEGCGVDCASLTELMLAERGGFSSDYIMFSSNVTPADEYRYARKLNAIINLDDITHIEFLKDTAGIPETVCCRFNPGGIMEVANGIMDNPGDAKYGMTRPQLTEAFKLLTKLGVKRFGLHAFLVSNALTELYYPKLAEILFKAAVELHEETGAEIAFINLSGGIGIPARPEQQPVDIMAVGDGVRKAYESILTPAGLGNVAIYTELGRFMTGPYGMLVSTVVHQKHTYKEYVGLDSCAVDLMRPAMYGAYHHVTVSAKRDAPADCMYDVTGSLCENNDKFAIDRMLPKIDISDLIIIHDTGAHGYSMGYNYNGKLKSKELLLREDGSVIMIRRAETPEDYFATLNYSQLS